MAFKQTSDKDPADWFEFAAERLKIADLAWKHEGFTPTGLECLQEAAERYLKGYLIAKGWQLQKTHDLERLMRVAEGIDKAFAPFVPMSIELTEKFFAQHYPGGDLTDLPSNYETLRSQVSEVIKIIKGALPNYFSTT
jgi:HEPN domain-containing protein